MKAEFVFYHLRSHPTTVPPLHLQSSDLLIPFVLLIPGVLLWNQEIKKKVGQSERPHWELKHRTWFPQSQASKFHPVFKFALEMGFLGLGI